MKRSEVPTPGLILGLDVGIASCGWAMVDAGNERIVAAGVNCFDAAEDRKGNSPNAARRQFRSLRRTTRRRAQRLRDVRHWLIETGLTTADAIRPQPVPPGTSDRPSPWELRAQALDKKLTDAELCRALLHMAKHRGFQSVKKGEGADNKTPEGRMLSAVAANVERSAKYKTVGEMLARDPAFVGKKRNARDDYSHTLTRDLLRHEARTIFREQRRLGRAELSDELADRFIKLAFSQRSLQSSETLVGRCSFEPAEPRAARHSYSFELFRYLSVIARARVYDASQVQRPFTADERAALIRLFDDQKEIKWSTIRRVLRLPKATAFAGLIYNTVDRKTGKIIDPEKKTVSDATGYHTLRGVVSERRGEEVWHGLTTRPEILDAIAAKITFNEDLEVIRAELAKLVDAETVGALMEAVGRNVFGAFRGAGHLSSVALRKIIPHLREGHVYSKACELAGYDHSKVDLPAIEDIRNPVVQRAVRETMAVVNAVVREHGLPERIIVETSRDLGRSREERDRISRELDKNKAAMDRLRDEGAENIGRPLSDDEFLKYRLWKEQGGRCIYTGFVTGDDAAGYISPRDLVDTANAVQIDHVLPYSRSQDDSYVNRVLCTTGMNQAKRNWTPFEWFGRGDDEKWRRFCAHVDSLHMKGFKKRRLKDTTFAEREPEFLARNLNDTRYIARLLLRHLSTFYSATNPDGSPDRSRRVDARAGAVTATLRRNWGLERLKKDPTTGERTSDDRHHAVDAMVVATTTPSIQQRIVRAAQARETVTDIRTDAGRIEPPWNHFGRDVVSAHAGIFVVRLSKRKGRGAGHEAEIRRIEKGRLSGRITQRLPLSKLTLRTLEGFKDKERNAPLYELLRRRLEEAKGDAAKAFAADKPVILRGRDGRDRRVTAIRVVTTEKSGVTVRGGLASNGDMVRVDVFQHGDEFHLVPVYAHQVAHDARPPDRSITRDRDEGNWRSVAEMSARFRFSLYANDFVELLKSSGEILEGYFRSADRNTASIAISRHNEHAKLTKSIGVKSLLSLRKFHVDRLGRRFEIKREPRLWRGAICT